MKYSLLVAFIAFTMQQTVSAQQSLPQVGKPMPDFTLDNVTNYTSTNASLKDFKGKWLFLDFWFTGCTSCIRNMPKMNNLQQRFKDKVQFMMVGINGAKYKNIEKVYEVLKGKYNLQLASAYDSVLHVKWDIWTMPYIIMIDPQGIVQDMTTGQDMTEEKMQALFEGKDIKIDDGNIDRPDFDISKFPGSQDSTLIYRSILTRWKGERSVASWLENFIQWPENMRRNGIKFTGYRLDQLYKIAYTGLDNFNVEPLPDGSLFYPNPIIECLDKTLFLYDSTYKTHKGLYNYNLSLPASKSNNLEIIKDALQAELHNAFGYEATIEERTFQVWKISATKKDVSKLASKGGEQQIHNSPVSMYLKNVPIQLFYKILVQQVSNFGRIFIEKNETGFEGNIDLELNAVLTDFEDVKKALKNLGFDIVLDTRKIKTLIIRDSQK